MADAGYDGDRVRESLLIHDIRLTARQRRGHSPTIALVPIPKKIVHLMCETTSFDRVGRALHRCQAVGVHSSFTLGRHSNDEMLSFHPLSPSGFDIEYGWGGLEVDETWHVLIHGTNSAWGHVFQRPPCFIGQQRQRTNSPEAPDNFQFQCC